MSSVDPIAENLNAEKLKATVDKLTDLLEDQKYQSQVTQSSNLILATLFRGLTLLKC